LKKILSIAIVAMLLFSNSVFALENTTEVTANIQVSIIDVDIPTFASFMIDPNGPTFIAPELYIENSSTMPVTVSLVAFDNKADTPNQFIETYKYDKAWRDLGANESKRFIYLGIGAEDIYQEGYVEGSVHEDVIPAIQVQNYAIEFASIRPGHTITLDMECNYGHAISGAFSTTYELVFIVSVMN
jgi:hypothetical protein